MSGQSGILCSFCFILDNVHNFWFHCFIVDSTKIKCANYKPYLVCFSSSFHHPLSLSLPTATSNPFSQKPQLFSTLLYSLVPIIGLAAVVLFSFWMWRHHKLAYPAALVPTHVSPHRGEKMKTPRPITAVHLQRSPVNQSVWLLDCGVLFLWSCCWCS